jgi:predicted deacylase
MRKPDTLSTGSIGPLWVYADYALEGVQRIAELAEPDMIKIDPGQTGTIETSFVERGVPAITLEIGPANNWNGTLISRSVEFIFRLMDDLQMTNGSTPTPDLSNTYIANNFSDVSVQYSGWVELDVTAEYDVTEGQVVGRVYNSWGDVLEELTSSVNGRVLTALVDPAVEAGAGVLTIGYNATSETD